MCRFPHTELDAANRGRCCTYNDRSHCGYALAIRFDLQTKRAVRFFDNSREDRQRSGGSNRLCLSRAHSFFLIQKTVCWLHFLRARRKMLISRGLGMVYRPSSPLLDEASQSLPLTIASTKRRGGPEHSDGPVRLVYKYLNSKSIVGIRAIERCSLQ